MPSCLIKQRKYASQNMPDSATRRVKHIFCTQCVWLCVVLTTKK